MIEITMDNPPILTIGIECFFRLFGTSRTLYFEPNLITKGTEIVEINPEIRTIRKYLLNKFKINF